MEISFAIQANTMMEGTTTKGEERRSRRGVRPIFGKELVILIGLFWEIKHDCNSGR